MHLTIFPSKIDYCDIEFLCLIDSNARAPFFRVKCFQLFFRCLSSQTPPLPGNRTDICRGTNPKTFERLQMEASEETKGKWTIYLVVAIFVTMLLTFCCTFAIMYFMCAANKDERSISP